MSFGDRTAEANTLVQVVMERLWDNPFIRARLQHVEYGAEMKFPRQILDLLRETHTATTHHIRFAPDFFVIDVGAPERTYLLEYKCTRSILPSSYSRRLEELRGLCGREDMQFEDVGQMEAAAFTNYAALHDMEVRVAILNYCSFHQPRLLCDFAQNWRPLGRERTPSASTSGSRTRYFNFDLAAVRPLGDFLADEHGCDLGRIKRLVHPLEDRLIALLPTKN